MYWAQELAAQNEDPDLKQKFTALSKALSDNEQNIVSELSQIQGKPVDIGGYYLPDMQKLSEVMCPSLSFNSILKNFKV
jgi:isocitrate dehydrogenase